MARFWHRRRARTLARVEFCEACGRACDQRCRAQERRARERDRALPWAVRA